MLPEKLLKLKERFIAEASLVENMLTKAMQGLIKKDNNLLEEVMNINEPNVNEMELEIDEKCLDLFALYQPEAIDLRTVLMILKMNNDLERMGDLAVNIAQSAYFLIERPDVKKLEDLPKMGDKTIEMLKDSINSYINEDVNLAKNVCERDDDVDSLANTILRDLIDYMIADKNTIERSLHILRIAKNLERIADLTTNIAEDVIFMKKGKVIKHGKEEI